MLHEKTVLAYELGRLDGDHPRLDRLEPLIPLRRGDGHHRFLLVGLVLVVPGLLLLEDLVDRLDVRPRRVRRGRSILEVFWRGLEVVEILVGSHVLVFALFRGARK